MCHTNSSIYKYSIDGKIAFDPDPEGRGVRQKDIILNLHGLYRVNIWLLSPSEITVDYYLSRKFYPGQEKHI